MLTFTFILSIAFEIGLPIFLAYWFIRRFRSGWLLIGVGALTFVASQIVHIPVLYGLTALFSNGFLPTPPHAYLSLFNAIILGLLAGICEEPARWVGFKVLKRRADSFGASLTLGVGHSGFESAVLIGLSVLINFIAMLSAHQTGNPPAGMAIGQVDMFWRMPWYTPLAGAFERLTAIILHLILSIMVWKSFSKGWGWFAGAVLYHALVDGTGVFLQSVGWGVWNIEGVFGGFMLLNIVFLYVLWKREKPDDFTRSEEVDLTEAKL
jgi:uncharacterized membrane protein YhfC